MSCSPYRRARRTTTPCSDDPLNSEGAVERPVPWQRSGALFMNVLEGEFSEAQNEQRAQREPEIKWKP